jgi:GT2 family glycosyltransferase
MLVTATIVIYKPQMSWLLKSIHSFIDKNNYDKKLYLIDNSPQPNKELKNLASDKVEYILNNENVGFGKAHNQGIKKAIDQKSDYHLILNPDVTFDSDILIELADFLNKDDSIGFISPKIYYTNGEIQRLCKLLPTPKQLILRRVLQKGTLYEKISNKLELGNFRYDMVAEIPWLSGCFLFAKTSHLQKIGGFDERFFMYMEDVDISRRSLKFNKNVFYPYVSIQHVYARDAYKSVEINTIFIISAIRYFNKWGWFFDKERDQINKETLEKLGLY